MRILPDFSRFGRFISSGLPHFSTNQRWEILPSNYEKLITYDDRGRPRCVPLAVTRKSEVHLVGVDAFNRLFINVSSLIASPGQGKSRLATTIYQLMRGTSEPYFSVSDSAISFTKGIWRLSDEHKKELMERDIIDILDVEGLQKENSVYYLMIVVVVLSQSIVLLSRERVNKEALGVLEIAFKILHRLGIALHKPVLFIQTKTKKDGTLLDGERNPISKDDLLAQIKRDIPIVGEFKVEFFGLTEVPEYETLKDTELSLNMPEGTADTMFQDATDKYETDVENLVMKLKEVKDKVPSEIRMHYLMKVLDHLNDKNPDLVLEQNLEFYEKDIKRCLDVMVCKEKEKIISAHRNKPLGKCKTLQEFFEPPSEDLYTQFNKYCENDSPFIGESKDKSAYQEKAQEIFEKSIYFTKVLSSLDPSTGEMIGIMSYVQPDFEAKKQTGEGVLKSIFMILKTEAESSYSIFTSKIPHSAPYSAIVKVKSKYENIDGIDDIIADRWKQVVCELEVRKEALIAESKWFKKCRTQGDLKCPSCGYEHSDGVGHRECKNDNDVPSVLWYWIKGSSKYAICNGCEKIIHLTGVACGECRTTLNAKKIPPDW